MRSRFLQLRATLRNDADAPSRLTGLSVAYRPLNRAPSIVRFDVEAPGIVVVPGPTSNAAAQGAIVADDPVARDATRRPNGARSRTPTRRGYAFGARTFRWAAEDADRDRLRYTVELRSDADDAWVPLATELTADYFSWDTRSVPDGDYRVRLTVDDGLDRAVDETLYDRQESALLTRDNTRPEIVGWERSRDKERWTIRFGVEDFGGGVAAVEWALDGDAWRPLVADDGVNDDEQESYTLRFEGGETLRLRVVDQAGNVNGWIESLR